MAIKLKGHETFALREGWLNKGLAKVDANQKFSLKTMGRMLLEWEAIWLRLFAIGLKPESLWKNHLKRGQSLQI